MCFIAMSLKIRSAFLVYVLFTCTLKILAASYPKSLREPAKYCGSRLTKQLHDFCKLFYGPSDHDPKYLTNEYNAITDECCEQPCSLLYIILSYCKKPKHEALANAFGKAELKFYKTLKGNVNNTLLNTIKVNGTALIPIKLREIIVPSKQHSKRNKRNKRTCSCRKNVMHDEKVKILLSRTVPEHIIGVVDYHDNEPIIIENSI